MIRAITPLDLPVFQEYYSRWFKSVFKTELLPFETTFYLPEKGFISLYLTNSSMGLIENLIVNPVLTKDERAISILNLNQHAEEEAAKRGVTLLIAVTTLPSVIKRASLLDYKIASANNTVLVKTISTRR